MSALSQSLDVEPALHAFDEDDAAPRRAQPERLQRTVFFRVVPAPRLLDVRKLGHDHPLGFPVTLQSLHLAASHEELAAVPRDGSRDLLPILLGPCWIGHLVIDDEIRWHARASSSRRRELSHSSDVPHRRLAEVPLVLAVEVRGIVVTDSVAGFRRVEIFAEHQPPGFLKPQLLLELQWTHRRHGSEVRMEPGHAHAQLSRDLLDPQRLVEVHAKFLDRANYAMRVTAERGEVAQAAGLGAREQAIHDFADHERRQHTVLSGRVYEPHEPQRRVEQVTVESADIDRLQAAAVAA